MDSFRILPVELYVIIFKKLNVKDLSITSIHELKGNDLKIFYF